MAPDTKARWYTLPPPGHPRPSCPEQPGCRIRGTVTVGAPRPPPVKWRRKAKGAPAEPPSSSMSDLPSRVGGAGPTCNGHVLAPGAPGRPRGLATWPSAGQPAAMQMPLVLLRHAFPTLAGPLQHPCQPQGRAAPGGRCTLRGRQAGRGHGLERRSAAALPTCTAGNAAGMPTRRWCVLGCWSFVHQGSCG